MQAEQPTRIDVTPPASATEQVEQLIAPYAQILGRTPGGLNMLGVSPPVLEHYLGTLDYYMQHPTLGQPLLTFIRYLVSWRGHCDYCVDLNEAFLMGAGLELEAIRAAREAPEQAPLEPRDKAMLLLALDAVDHPERITAERTETLRAAGWTDRDMFDAVWHATGNRAFGRTADAFGLTPDG